MQTAAAYLDSRALRPPPDLARSDPDAMSPSLDALSLECVIGTRGAARPVLDIGCGDGVATAAVLSRGGRAWAIDPDPKALKQLKQRIPEERHARLRALPGALPDIDFQDVPFAAVHAARVLHHLDGAALEIALRKFFRWVYPHGRLYLSVLTPLGSHWKSIQREFIRRSADGMRWPGYFADRSIHLLNERILRAELVAVGFAIDKANYYPLPWDSTQVCCAMVARCAPH